MKLVGDTVRYRDEENRNFTALVVEVQDETSISLVYCPESGRVERVDSVMHRSKVNPPSRHWL